ncbi:MAG: hypothetical protein KBD95_05620 [Veillonella sp.]|nr:hypothetical protein [Veillonella sp.]
MKTLGPNNPDLVQIASAALGYATNKLVGEDALAGAALAQWGTKWNLTLENPELMVTMGFAYIVANSILHINGTVLAVQDATGEWIKTAEANAYIRMIEEIRDCNGDVIYDFPEDPQDFIPEGLAKKNIQILEIPICILVIGFQMQMGKLKENSYVVGYKKNED